MIDKKTFIFYSTAAIIGCFLFWFNMNAIAGFFTLILMCVLGYGLSYRDANHAKTDALPNQDAFQRKGESK